MYPDVIVACGDRRDTGKEVSDPVAIIEILSPGTARGANRWAFGTIPSLRHYVLIAQDRPEAEVTTADGEVWRSVVLRDASARLRLDSLGLDIALAEVFADIDLTVQEREAGQA